MGKVCYKLPKIYKLDNIESYFNAIFIENSVFTVYSGIIQNPVVSLWYYHMPFFRNFEIQVRLQVLKSVECRMFYVVCRQGPFSILENVRGSGLIVKLKPSKSFFFSLYFSSSLLQYVKKFPTQFLNYDLTLMFLLLKCKWLDRKRVGFIFSNNFYLKINLAFTC